MSGLCAIFGLLFLGATRALAQCYHYQVPCSANYQQSYAVQPTSLAYTPYTPGSSIIYVPGYPVISSPQTGNSNNDQQKNNDTPDPPGPQKNSQQPDYNNPDRTEPFDEENGFTRRIFPSNILSAAISTDLPVPAFGKQLISKGVPLLGSLLNV